MIRFTTALVIGATAACGGNDGATLFRGVPTCDPPDVARQEFRHTLSGRGDPHHAANDVIVAIGQPAKIRAKFSYGKILKDLEDEDVALLAGEGACGPWISEDVRRPDDDGWVVFEVPALAEPGIRTFHAIVAGDGSRASGRIWSVAPGTRAVLFDIDGTLTTGDTELLEDLLGDDAPNMRPGAPEVANHWDAQGAVIVYMTGRPYFLRSSSRGWLEANGFPPGVLFTVEEHRDALPTTAGVGTFKKLRVQAMIEAGLVFDAAYGNAATDVCAYAEGGIDPAVTWITELDRGACGDRPAPNPLPSYVDHLTALTAARVAD
jgi:hypothetical protein